MEDFTPVGEVHPQLISPRVKRTSKAVFSAIIEEGLLTRQRKKVYELLFTQGPLTGREVNAKLNTVSGHKRLSELQRLDVADTYGSKRCSVTDRIVEAWDVTGRMPVMPELAVAPSPKHKLLRITAKANRLAAVLRSRPLPESKEEYDHFVGRYLLWLNGPVKEVVDDIEEESDE